MEHPQRIAAWPTDDRRPSLRREIRVLVVAILGLTLYANSSFLVTNPDNYRFFPPFQARVDANVNTLLGAEYRNIAVALAKGRGFSDPFGQESGPTAWMPPLYPALLAGLFLATGFQGKMVAACIVLLKGLTLILTGVLLLHVAQRTAARLKPRVVLGLYLGWLVAHFWWFFQQTHDIWLLLVFADLTLAGVWTWLRTPAGGWRYAAWGLFGGAQFLTSPVSGLAWSAVTAVHGLRERRLAPTVGALALAAACCSVWVVRNEVVFDRPIFIKSNLFYELYASTFLSKDGLYDEVFFLTLHPYAETLRNTDSGYRRLGEIAYTEAYRDRFLQSFRARPGVYFDKMKNRLLAATLVHKAYNRKELWPTLTRVVRPLPLLGLLVLLAVRRLRIGRTRGFALLFAAAYLAPYVAVAFYTRYLLALTPVLVLFVFWGADAAAERFSRRDARV